MSVARPTRIVKPSTRVERAHWGAGRDLIVGADAVGVACLSGPVLAAAVVMPPYARRIPGVRDSKMLSRAQRERLAPIIRRRAIAVGLGAASVAEIDRLNIYHATNLAMRRAICRIAERDHVLIDGLRVHRFEDFVGPYTALVKGDARCYSIAAASIVAKVVRDRLMDRLARRYPEYGWDHNAGYATLDHRHGIENHGITPYHRRSFARVRAVALGTQLELELDGTHLEELAVALTPAYAAGKPPIIAAAHARRMADPRHQTGLAAEEAIARWLNAAGWRVLDRRCRPGAGAEVDIVALDPRGALVGIECRARRTDRAGSPAESVDRRRIARLRRAVAAYAVTSGVRHRGLRVDLVTARPEPGGTGRWAVARIEGIG